MPSASGAREAEGGQRRPLRGGLNDRAGPRGDPGSDVPGGRGLARSLWLFQETSEASAWAQRRAVRQRQVGSRGKPSPRLRVREITLAPGWGQVGGAKVETGAR